MVLEEHLIDRFRLFYLIASLEADLRDILREWVAPFLDDRTLYAGLYETLVTRRRADGHSEATATLLDYLDFSDSYQLLNRYRSMLPPQVADAVRRFTPRLEPLVQPRNRVMHTRVFQPGDEELVVRVCGDFLDTGLDLPRLRAAVRRLQTDPAWTPQIERQGGETVAHNLPLPDFDETGLLGRQRENDDLLRRLLNPRDPILTVVGEGGIGKTALVVKTLDDLLQHPDCPYLAVLWTSLKTERLTGRGIEQVQDAARDVLGAIGTWLPVLGEEQPADDLAALVEALDGVPALIAIDNLETTSAKEVIDFYDRLPQESRLLTTSRVGLGQLERRIELEPLDSRSATLLLRKYAQRRGVKRLVEVPEEALSRQAERLRRNPLALRWYVEAVEAGQDPEAILANQRDFLRFCLETIYEGLNETARQLLSVLSLAGRRLDVAELAFLTERDPDDVRRALHDLARRSLVITRLTGEEATHEVFALGSSTELYLSSIDRPSDVVAEQIAEKQKRLRETHEQLALAAQRNPLSPRVVDDLDGQAGPVTHLLMKALRPARTEAQRTQARALVEQARRLAPEMYEVHRVDALLSSRSQPERATEGYERALELAPTAEARARVAYYFSEHLANVIRDTPRAIALAEQAHDHYGLPATAARLGRFLTFRGAWDDAERLLRLGITDEDVRAALIARTQLVELARRKVEHLVSEERLPGDAIRYGSAVLQETATYLATGRVDEQLLDSVLRLASEILRPVRGIDDLGALSDELAAVLRFLDARRRQLATNERRRYTLANLQVIAGRDDAPTALADLAREVLLGVMELIEGPVHVGRVKNFSRTRGYGFLVADSGADLFFHVSAVPEANDQIALIEGALVEYTDGNDTDGRPLAERVLPNADISGEALTQRRARVLEIRQNYCIAEDEATHVTVLVHRLAFIRAANFDALDPGDILRLTYELTVKGPRAAQGSVVVVYSAPSRVRHS